MGLTSYLDPKQDVECINIIRQKSLKLTFSNIQVELLNLYIFLIKNGFDLKLGRLSNMNKTQATHALKNIYIYI